MLEQVLVLPQDDLVVQGHFTSSLVPLERLEVEYDQEAGRCEVLGEKNTYFILDSEIAHK